MGTVNSPPNPNNTPAATKPEAGLPEERFWKHYSPHHEFPLSTVISLVAHGILVGLFVYWGVIGLLLHLDKKDKPLAMDPIVVAGGGGNPNGAGSGPGDLPPPNPGHEAVDQNKPVVQNPNPPKEPTPEENLQGPPPEDFKIPPALNDRIISATSNPSIAGVANLSKNVQNDLFKGLAAGKGQGGSGSGGGLGKGHGTGEGDMSGAGKANISQRQKRVLRWTMIFDTLNGQDYLRQLAFFKAILAVPLPEGGYEELDLSKRPLLPRTVTNEELGQIRRIFWVDNQPQSVGSLSRALGLPFQPPHIVAFFPESFEKELLTKELGYRGRSEDEIKETKFKIARSGGGYEPVVVEQVPQ